MQAKPKLDIRSHVTLEYGGKDPLIIKLVGQKPLPLKPGDNEVPIGLFHMFGLDANLTELIATGVIHPVCRTHKFPVVDAEELSEFHARGLRVSVGEEHPDRPHCKYCGHTRETAAAADEAKAQAEAAAVAQKDADREIILQDARKTAEPPTPEPPKAA